MSFIYNERLFENIKTAQEILFRLVLLDMPAFKTIKQK